MEIAFIANVLMILFLLIPFGLFCWLIISLIRYLNRKR